MHSAATNGALTAPRQTQFPVAETTVWSPAQTYRPIQNFELISHVWFTELWKRRNRRPPPAWGFTLHTQHFLYILSVQAGRKFTGPSKNLNAIHTRPTNSGNAEIGDHSLLSFIEHSQDSQRIPTVEPLRKFIGPTKKDMIVELRFNGSEKPPKSATTCRRWFTGETQNPVIHYLQVPQDPSPISNSGERSEGNGRRRIQRGPPLKRDA